jgi:hypothetical protein
VRLGGAFIYEVPVDLDEIIAACHLDSRGAVQELALQGLREAGWDVETISRFDPDETSAALADGRPLIIGLTRSQRLAHAVVVCAIDTRNVTVMDPAEGEYVEIPLIEVLLQMEEGLGGGFYIAGPDFEAGHNGFSNVTR